MKNENECIPHFKLQTSDIVVLVYVNDCIILSRGKKTIELFVNSLKHGPEEIDFTYEGLVDKYLGVDIECLPDKSGFIMSQPFLIKKLSEAAQIDLWMTNNIPTPIVGPLLSHNENGPDCKHDWKYQTLTELLVYLQQTSRPNISRGNTSMYKVQ